MKNHAVFDRPFIRFLFVGAINTLCGSAVMFALYNLAGCSYWASSAANYLFGGVLSFFLHKYVTFRVTRWSVKMVAGFIVTVALAYLWAYGLAKPVVAALMSAYTAKTRGNVSLLAGMCLFTGLNYAGQRFVVFKVPKKEKENDC